MSQMQEPRLIQLEYHTDNKGQQVANWFFTIINNSDKKVRAQIRQFSHHYDYQQHYRYEFEGANKHDVSIITTIDNVEYEFVITFDGKILHLRNDDKQPKEVILNPNESSLIISKTLKFGVNVGYVADNYAKYVTIFFAYY